MGFWKTVIAGVVTALITGVGGMLFGFTDLLLDYLGKTWLAIKQFWGYTFNISIGFIILSGITCVVLNVLFKRFKIGNSKLGEKSPIHSFSGNEESIIQLLAEADGRWLSLVLIAEHLHLSNLIVEHSIDSLIGKGMLVDKIDMLNGAKFRLSTDGRDYAINKGYVR